MIAAWTPPQWVYNCFPMPAPNTEVVTLRYVVDAMHAEADRCTEADGNPLGRVLHVAHMLVSHQGADGLWPAMLNLRTGEEVGTERSDAPRDLMRRLNHTLDSTEFDYSWTAWNVWNVLARLHPIDVEIPDALRITRRLLR